MKRVLIIGSILILFSKLAFAEPVDLKVQVDKGAITIGERIKYDVLLEYDDGIEIEPLALAGNLGEFEIKDYSIDEPKKNKSGRLVSKTSYAITTFTTGEFKIPPITIKYKDKSGKEQEITSEEIKINVKSVKPGPNDKDDVRPLKNPAGIKENFPAWLIFVLVLILAGGVVAFIYFRRKKKIEEKPALPPRPPEEIAKEALKALLEMRLIEKGMIKEYYIRLSDIIRAYIEARYRIFALDRTTWELYQEMRSKKIERAHADKIRDFLEDCDLVKFAKFIPTAKEIDEDYKEAEELVEITAEPMRNVTRN